MKSGDYSTSAIEFQIEELNSVFVDNRIKALRELEKAGNSLVIEPVMRLLEDRDRRVRLQTVRTLAMLGDQRIQEAMIKVVQEGDEDICYWASRALNRIRSPHLVASIRELIGDESSISPKVVFWLFQSIAYDEIESQECLISYFSSRFWINRKSAFEALIRIKNVSLELLTFGLKDEDSNKRFWCIKTMGELRIAESLEYLKESLETEQRSDLRIAALEALSKIGTADAFAFIKLKLKQDPDEEIRYTSVKLLGKQGSTYCELITSCLTDSSWSVREAVISYLSSFGENLLPFLNKISHNENEDIKFAIAKSAYKIGLPAQDLLFGLLGDNCRALRQKVSEYLSAFGDELIAGVTQRLPSASVEFRLGTVELLGSISGERAQDLLVSLLDDPDFSVRYEALCRVSRYSVSNITERLLTLIKDSNEEIRNKAVDLLAGEIKLVPRLLDMLKDPVWVVRMTTSRLLGKMGGEIVPSLIKHLNTEDPDSRYWTIKTLGYIGKDSFGELFQLLDNPVWIVRKNAADALLEIGQVIPDLLIEKITNSFENLSDNQLYWGGYILSRYGKSISAKMTELLNIPSQEMRSFVLSVIKNGNYGECLEIRKSVIDCLADEYWKIRQESIAVLGSFRDPELLEYIKPFEQDEDENTQLSMIKAMGKMGVCTSSDYLETMVNKGSWSLRRELARALATIDDAVCNDLLIQLIHDPVEYVAREALLSMTVRKVPDSDKYYWQLISAGKFVNECLQALIKSGINQGNPELLETLLKSDDPLVRGNAVILSGIILGQAFQERAETFLTDEYIFVRNSARTVIEQYQGEKEIDNAASVSAAKTDLGKKVSKTGAELREGIKLFKTKDYQGAISKFRQVLSEEPDNILALCQIGLVFQELGNLKRAEEFFVKSLNIDSGHNLPRIYLGVLYGSAGRIMEMKQILEPIVEGKDETNRKLATRIVEKYYV